MAKSGWRAQSKGGGYADMAESGWRAQSTVFALKTALALKKHPKKTSPLRGDLYSKVIKIPSFTLRE